MTDPSGHSWNHPMRRALVPAVIVLLSLAAGPLAGAAEPSVCAEARIDGGSDEESVRLHGRAVLEADLGALETYRPGYSFWKHVFLIPDGSVVYGSAEDGRLLARFPSHGDWASDASIEDTLLAAALDGASLERRLDDRRDQVARLLGEAASTPIVHNPTRGDFLLSNAERYGGFLHEWGRIYERFGVPAELGLAQAAVESGFAGRTRSEVRAIGFCQWMPRNWNRLEKLSPYPLEGYNQTTQAPYCAAYLTVLATKYGSFLPALSEHHAGIANVGRTIHNGARLGGSDPAHRYLLGGQFARDLRILSPRTFRDLVGSYGPRSYYYTEMVFGNRSTIEAIRESTPQQTIYAMRARRALPIAEVARASRLSVQEVRRFNPALVRRVPRGANVYLPIRVEDFGPDVSFWHRPAPPEFAALLREFVSLRAEPEEWDDPAFEPVLEDFRDRFRATDTEEGTIMATVLGYVLQELPTVRRVLTDFRSDPAVARLFEEGVRVRAEGESRLSQGAAAEAP